MVCSFTTLLPESADSEPVPGESGTFACADEDGGAVVPVTWTGTTVGSGDDRISYCSYYDGGEDYFFQFIAPSDGTYIFDTIGTSFVPILSLYESCGWKRDEVFYVYAKGLKAT